MRPARTADGLPRQTSARPAPRSTTRVALRWLQGSLLAGAVLLAAISALALQDVQGTVATVHDHTVPAVLEVEATRAALVAADEAAVDSLSVTGAQLTGPGTGYRNQMAVAAESLAELAKDGVASAAGSIQLIEGLLVSYTSLVEQADSDYQVDTAPAVHGIGNVAVDLWNAAALLHGQIMPRLDDLQAMEEQAFSDELSSGWIAPGRTALWAIPMTALLGLLVGTQVFLDRRFRRRFNLRLVAATALVLAAAAGMSAVLEAHGQLDDARSTLARAVGDWEQPASMADGPDVARLLQPCGQAIGGCGEGIANFLHRTSGAPAAGGRGPALPDLGTVDGLVAAAGDPGAAIGAGGATLQMVAATVPALELLAAALVLWGLRPRVDQYRYRPA